MNEFFLTIINMSISASWIVLVVLLLRVLLKKVPKWLSVILWGIVAIRLVCPFNFESEFSLMPSTQTISPEMLMDTTLEINTGIPFGNNVINLVSDNSVTPASELRANTLQIFTSSLCKIWILGVAVLVIHATISYIRIRSRVKTAVLLRDNIYKCETVISPFVIGFIKAKIYLPFNMDEQYENYVTLHEQAHIRRKDNIWKPLGFLLLTIYWFNPLMWLGYVLLCRDIELACDEKVVKEMSIEQRADYSEALLSCSVNRRMIAACPLAFGEVGVKERVKSVLNYKKPAFWILIVGIVVIFVASACLLTNPKASEIGEIDDELQVFLDMQVAEHNSSHEQNNNFIAVSYDLMKVEQSGLETTVYAWILYLEYSCKNDILTEEAGSHVPTVITAKKNNNKYELVEYWVPRDGNYYGDDIKEKFPMYLWSRAMDGQSSIDKQNAECEQMAKEYFNISESTVGEDEGVNVQCFESTVSFVNWPGDGSLYFSSLNSDKMYISSVQHLPIYKFDILKDLEQFKESFGDKFAMDRGLDEVTSFNSAIAKYNSDFFKNNSLMLIYVGANNSTHRFNLHSVEYDDNSFCVHIAETTQAEAVDTAMAGWFVTVVVSDELIKNCTEFDADLNNGIELLKEVDTK